MSNSLLQNSYYIGTYFNGILYGVELVLYFQTMQKLRRMKKPRTRPDAFFMIFSTALLVLITIYMSTEAVFGEEMWIVNADYPGGADAYFADHVAVWYQTMGTASSVILNLLTDGLLIYRCLVVWNNYYVLVFPCFLWVASLGLGVAELYASGTPSGDFFTGLAEDIGVAYYSTSIGLNVVVTSLICGRVLRLNMAMRTDPRLKHSARYAGTIPIIVESALPYTLFGIAFLVSYGIGSSTSILWLSFYVMFTCISPQMIVLRVVDGNAWTMEQRATASGHVMHTFGTTSVDIARDATSAFELPDSRSIDDRKSSAGSMQV